MARIPQVFYPFARAPSVSAGDLLGLQESENGARRVARSVPACIKTFAVFALRRMRLPALGKFYQGERPRRPQCGNVQQAYLFVPCFLVGHSDKLLRATAALITSKGTPGRSGCRVSGEVWDRPYHSSRAFSS